MFFMGVGSYLSKFVHEELLDCFVMVEVWVGIVGGVSAFLLYLSFSLTEYYYIAAFLLIAARQDRSLIHAQNYRRRAAGAAFENPTPRDQALFLGDRAVLCFR